MCGITFIFKPFDNTMDLKLKSNHRGPDATSLAETEQGTFVFHRLAINDVSKGNQPFVSDNCVMVCNGEIYNHKNLETRYDIQTKTGSDCEVLFWMLKYSATGGRSATFEQLNAEFACVYEDELGEVVAARDPSGVRPLFVGYREGQMVGFSSEAKGFDLHFVDRVEPFPPGCFWSSHTREFRSYKTKENKKCDYTFEQHVDKVRTLLTNAVERRVRMSERPVAFFLSGGLDSSIIAAVGAQCTNNKRVTTFSIGTNEHSPDLEAARIMAKFIGSNHVEVMFDPNEATKHVSRVIRSLESYDCTTVRASVPMFLLAEHVKETSDFRVILSGEGADELFGGYLYFHNAPSNEAFQEETVRLLKNIHQFDGLRADRCTAAHGLELRAPFLDPPLVDYVTNKICPNMKNPKENHGIEKRLLREAFAHLLPPEILHRQKNGMSDAVGYSWVDHLRDYAKTRLNLYPRSETTFTKNPPMTDEERWYRELYHEHYPGEDLVCSHETIWRPRWSEGVTDPSARRLVNVFKET